MKPPLISIVGTTASGKSTLGIELAKRFDGEVVSADSRQIYRGFDLGTGKVTKEEADGVIHHLIDIRNVGMPFSMGEFQKLAYLCIDDIGQRGKTPFLVGGTGLYARSVVEGYTLVDVVPDEDFRREMEKKSWQELVDLIEPYGEKITDRQISCRRLIRILEKYRAGCDAQPASCPRYRTLQLGLTWQREVLNRRIEQRLDARLAAGMVEEVKGLLESGATEEFMEMLGLEYRYTCRYLKGGYPSFSAYREQLLTEIKRFAKRQQTWFRRDRGIIWLDESGDYTKQAVELTGIFLKNNASLESEDEERQRDTENEIH